MTDKELFAFVRNTCGLTICKQYGEYRINFRNGPEASAYYTNDKLDAGDTAKSMAGIGLHSIC